PRQRPQQSGTCETGSHQIPPGFIADLARRAPNPWPGSFRSPFDRRRTRELTSIGGQYVPYKTVLLSSLVEKTVKLIYGGAKDSPMPKENLNDLQAFVAVARERSFT
ncbi:LysR family transcriptional regulator, partial [Pseudomonas aeruginosa]|uniref:LysR family transcriptional regulator n=1 Tax=Pseudomonas aeruginosa TaxID=287 RepID=UPI0031B72E62